MNKQTWFRHYSS